MAVSSLFRPEMTYVPRASAEELSLLTVESGPWQCLLGRRFCHFDVQVSASSFAKTPRAASALLSRCDLRELRRGKLLVRRGRSCYAPGRSRSNQGRLGPKRVA